MKKNLSLLMVLGLMIGSTLTVNAAEFTDTSSHWAKQAISEWSDYGIVGGYENGTFKPANNITRAELAALIDKIMEYEVAGADTFSDLKGSEWYAESILNNVGAGNMSGYSDGTIGAKRNVTRQEVAVMLCNAFNIEPVSGNTTFSDDSSIPGWSKPSVNALSQAGYINGRPGNKFDAKSPITRAEVVATLDNIVSDLYTTAGTYTTVSEGNVLVNTEDVVLKDTLINGDLFVAAGVSDGDLTLDNVTVRGNLIVEGGGANSIRIINNTTVGGVNVQKNAANTVRVYVDSSSRVSQVSTSGNANVKLDGSGTFGNVSSNGTNTIEVASDATISKVQVNAGGKVIINGIVDSITTSSNASATTITGSGSAKTITVGNGKVTIDLNVDKVIVQNTNASVTISDKVDAVVDGTGKDIKDQILTGNTTTGTGSTGGNSSSNGNTSNGGGGGSTTTDTTAPVLTNIKASNVTTTSATLTFNSNEVGSYVCTFDGRTVASGTLSGSNTINFKDLTPGITYTGNLAVRDASGNARNYEFTITTLSSNATDTTAPVVSNSKITNVDKTTAMLVFDSTEAGTMSYKLNSGTAVEKTLVSGQNTVELSGLTPYTTYTLALTVSDASGNKNNYSFEFKTLTDGFIGYVSQPNTQVNKIIFKNGSGVQYTSYVGAYYNNELITSSNNGEITLMTAYPYATMTFKDANGTALVISEFK